MPCRPARSNVFGVYDCWASVANGSLLRCRSWGRAELRRRARRPHRAPGRFPLAAGGKHADRARPRLPHAAPSGAAAAAPGTRAARPARGIPIVDRAAGRFLSVLVHCMQANRILEIGTAYGYSTLWMALALPPAGRIWTIDPDIERTQVAATYFRRAGVEDQIEIINQPALEVLHCVSAAQPRHRVHRRDQDRVRSVPRGCVPMLKRSGIVVVDNLLWSGRAAAAPEVDRRRADPRRSARSTRRFSTIPSSTRRSCRSATASASVLASTDDVPSRHAALRDRRGDRHDVAPTAAIHGFTVNAFTSVSAEPPTVLICVNRGATAHPLIAASQASA